MTNQEAPTIPYTHWMYFSDRSAAERCATELGGLDFLCGIDRSVDVDDAEWLLRAARDVAIEDMVARHETVEAIVVRHGGLYDGGESGWLGLDTVEGVRQKDER